MTGPDQIQQQMKYSKCMIKLLSCFNTDFMCFKGKWPIVFETVWKVCVIDVVLKQGEIEISIFNKSEKRDFIALYILIRQLRHIQGFSLFSFALEPFLNIWTLTKAGGFCLSEWEKNHLWAPAVRLLKKSKQFRFVISL